MIYNNKSIKFIVVTVLLVWCLDLLNVIADNNLFQIYLERARLYYESGHTNEVIEECEKVLASQPNNNEAQSMIAEIKSKFKDTEAIKIIEKAIAEGPYFVDSLYYFGLLIRK